MPCMALSPVASQDTSIGQPTAASPSAGFSGAQRILSSPPINTEKDKNTGNEYASKSPAQDAGDNEDCYEVSLFYA